MKTAEGRLEVALPQVQGSQQPFRSRLLAFPGEHTEVLEKLAGEMYARGLSPPKVEAAFSKAIGACLLSKSGVSERMESLWEE